MDELEKVRLSMKQKRKTGSTIPKQTPKKTNHWQLGIVKLFITIVITLLLLIVLKSNPTFKEEFYKKVLESNFSFATFNEYYQKYFGTSLPFKNLLKEPVKTTFHDTLVYQNIKKYQEGAELTVASNYLVPIKKSGLVVFIGEKEGYGKVVIVQQMDGIDLWYGNLKEVNVKLYDYVEEGSLLGEVNEKKLYLVFKQEGKALDYQEYIE